jgi:Domain of unknown function (DUF4149)
MNAAIWLGAAIFFTFCIGPAPFSAEMKDLLGPKNSPYFSGAIAQILIARFFTLQLICGIIAVAHTLAESLYLGRTAQKLRIGLLVFLVAGGLIADFWLQPKLKRLHAIKYAVKTTPQERESASDSFKAWHGFSQGVNLLMLAALTIYLWRVANPEDATRFVSTAKFRS